MDSAKNIRNLARLRMLSDSYVDFRGNKTPVPVERLAKVLGAMGHSLENGKLEDAVHVLEKEQFKVGLPPVKVLRPHLPSELSICLSLDSTANESRQISWTLIFESGKRIEGQSNLIHHLDVKKPSHSVTWFRFLLNAEIPLGYHFLEVNAGGDTFTTQVIQTPEVAYQNEAIASGKKIWGSAIQLYTLKSDENWGMGDFTDLKHLITLMAEQGAGFIGLNPLHALYPVSPEHASPYSPSNRSMLNPLYIDPTQEAEFATSIPAQQWYQSAQTQSQLQRLRAESMVQYTEVSSLKNRVFEWMYDEFKASVLNTGSQRDVAFKSFVAQGGKVLSMHCLFEALLSHFKALDVNAWGWPKWPLAFQDSSSEEVKAFEAQNSERIQYYQYLQFMASGQLESAHIETQKNQMPLGLYRDLAVGADLGGSEVWGSKNTYCLDVSVGAPPDAIGPTGQNWGLSPMDPIQLKKSGYESFITLVRNNLHSCSALRIDHAMALFRLWWCPPGETAAEGVYVNYPFEDLLGILLLESQRNQCLIIAEDLGTVPDEVYTAFPRSQLFSNKVFYFEIDGEKGCTSPNAYPEKSLAIVANHDMPTLAAFWDKSDLELRNSLGMFVSDDILQQEKDWRDVAKKHVIDALVSEKLLTRQAGQRCLDSEDMTLPLCHAIHAYMAKSSAQMIVVQLEDVMLINPPVNVPGTSDQYPNWRRKLTRNSDSFFADKVTRKFCTELNRYRNSAI